MAGDDPDASPVCTEQGSCFPKSLIQAAPTPVPRHLRELKVSSPRPMFILSSRGFQKKGKKRLLLWVPKYRCDGLTLGQGSGRQVT